MREAKIKLLPLNYDFETKEILLNVIKASRALGELKGEVKTIPNQNIIINTLGLQEAKESSAIENIITTYDELYRSVVDKSKINSATKEIQNYSKAISYGFSLVKKRGILTTNDIIKIHEILAPNYPIRKLPGTVLKNDANGEVIYMPPQNYDDIMRLLSNLEKYINDDALSDIDPLIKMAIIHYQFESIHPFYDGNGRMGRILNILYLVLKGLLDIPVLYLSRYIIQNKSDYYRLLQAVRTNNAWEEWIVWLLNGINITALDTIRIIRKIKTIMNDYKQIIRSEFKFYSHDLINNLFKYPYTKIEFLEHDLKIHRNTASSYLNQLTKRKLLKKVKLGKVNYYINVPLFELLKNN